MSSVSVLELLTGKRTGPRILLGCSGSVATIKVPIIARHLQETGASVIVVPTRQAIHFLKLTATENIRIPAQTYSIGQQLKGVEKKTRSEEERASCGNEILTKDESSIIINSCTKQSESDCKFDTLTEKSLKPMYCFSCALGRSQVLQNVTNCPLEISTFQKTEVATSSNVGPTIPTASDAATTPIISTTPIVLTTPSTTNTPPLPTTDTPPPPTTDTPPPPPTPRVPSCPWCCVQQQYPDLVIAGDTLEWELWQGRGDTVLHIELRRWADVFLIAPLSANTLAKLACGLCDNLLTCVARAWDVAKPLLFCPAMNTLMYQHPLTARHLHSLKSLGYTEVPVVSKLLVCGDVGAGAMAEVPTILAAVRTAVQ